MPQLHASSLTARGLGAPALAGLLVSLLAGCGSSSEAALAESTVPPLTSETYAHGMAQCLADRDWQAWVVDNTVEASYRSSDEELFVRDYAECEASIGADKPANLTTDQLRALYVEYLATVRCLSVNGWVKGDAVSESKFLNDTVGNHYAYQLLDPARLEQIEEIEKICPQPEL